MGKLKVTEWLAIWGAIISTITLVWNILRDIRSRGKLKVECYISNLLDIESSIIEKKDLLVWKITNIGRKPIILTQIGGGKKKKQFFIRSKHSLPFKLNPGEYLMEMISSLKNISKDLNFLGAWDSLHNIYKAPKKQLKKIIEFANKINDPNCK